MEKPTFRLSYDTHKQPVENGFVLNGNVITITDNFHTEFEKITALVSDENHMTLTVYAVDNLQSIFVRFGVQEVGIGHVYETGIVLDLQRDYKSDDGYIITGIMHEQKDDLIDNSRTVASVINVKCNENSNSKSCYSFDVYFVLNAPLKHDVVLIGAVDQKRRVQTTYINHGVEL